MSSRIGLYLWWLTASVHKWKAQDESVWGRLLDAIGAVMDEVYDTIHISRRRRFILNPDQEDSYGENYVDVEPSDPEDLTPVDIYYQSGNRAADLNHHGLDRGLRRNANETNSAFAWRIATHPFRAQYLGTASGIKYVIEELFGLQCTELVEYYNDRFGWQILELKGQPVYAEEVLSHLFSIDDQAIYPIHGQTRIYSNTDLSTAFHFWVRVENPDQKTFDPEALIETIQQTKPAHTRALVHIVE